MTSDAGLGVSTPHLSRSCQPQDACSHSITQWDVGEFDLSKDGRWIAFEANEDGISKLHILDTKSTKKFLLQRFRSESWRAFNGESQPRTRILPEHGEPALRRILRGHGFREGRALDFQRNGRSQHFQFSEPQLIHWKSLDDHSISAFMYKPPAKFSGKHPVIIDIHGGPEGQVRPDFLGHDNYYHQ